MTTATLIAERGLPASIAAEQSILGGILLDNVTAADAMESLTADDFSLDSNRRIYRAITDLISAGRAVDVVTLQDALKRRGDLEAIGGIEYLFSLTEGLPPRPSVEQYVRIVRDKSILRGIIHAANAAIARAADDKEPVGEILSATEADLFALTERRVKRSFAAMGDIFRTEYGTLDKFYDPDRRSGLETGFGDFDLLTGGLHNEDLVIIAARPSLGKTALAMQIAENAAVRQNKVVGVFSMEMSRAALLERQACSMSNVSRHALRSGSLAPSQRRHMDECLGQLFSAPLFIDDAPAQRVSEMRAKARRLKHQKGALDLLVVDYLQLMSSDRRAENRTQEVTAFSQGLKTIAKELQCPVIALSQLSRECEKRMDKRPVLADLRESGAIEQDADIVAFIYREEFYKPNDPNMRGKAELIIRKHRNGPTDTVHLRFVSDFARFENRGKR